MSASTTLPADAIRQLAEAIRERAVEPAPLLMDADGAAAFAGQSRSALYRGVAAGTFPRPVDTPSGPRWRRADLEKWAGRLRPRKKRVTPTCH